MNGIPYTHYNIYTIIMARAPVLSGHQVMGDRFEHGRGVLEASVQDRRRQRPARRGGQRVPERRRDLHGVRSAGVRSAGSASSTHRQPSHFHALLRRFLRGESLHAVMLLVLMLLMLMVLISQAGADFSI